MPESLAEKAARARRGERVSGGTEVSSAERGTETYYDAQTGGYRNRPTVGKVAPAEKEAPAPGLASVIEAKRKKKQAAEAITANPKKPPEAETAEEKS